MVQAQQQPTALVIGEAIVDIVERAGEAPEEHLGGSPANVAVGLARLGHPTTLLTRLGDDERGRRFAARLAEEGVVLAAGSRGAGPTPTARARIARGGQADYVFDIDWRLPADAAQALGGAAPPALVHAGSIALVHEPGGTRTLELLRRAPESAIITVDPNIRPALLGDRAAVLARFVDAVDRAHLLKLSDEDAEWLAPGADPEQYARELLARHDRLRIVVVTRGAAGAIAVDARGRRIAVPAAPARVVDTISAGDSFMAALASSLLDHGLAGVERDIEAVLRRAARAAAHAVSAAGAHPPRRAELDG